MSACTVHSRTPPHHPPSSFRAQQKAFDWFIEDYNEIRPHESLAQKPPASCYCASDRNYPARVSEPEYAADITVRQVRSNGQIKWKGDTIYLSEALRGEPVGLLPRDERFWTIQFGPLVIGLLDDHARCILHTPTKVLPTSPICTPGHAVDRVDSSGRPVHSIHSIIVAEGLAFEVSPMSPV